MQFATTAAVIKLGRLSLLFGRTNRITFHEDGQTVESDTDHTVMLGLIACSFAQAHLNLDVGLIAQYALVHDLVEAYAGDTPTLRLPTADDKASKAMREDAAYMRIAEEFSTTLPWVCTMIADYELRRTPEARYVKAMDKMLPKITHLLNNCVTIRREGMTHDELMERYSVQGDELMEYASDFPELFELRADLLDMVLEKMRPHMPTECWCGNSWDQRHSS